MSSSSGNLFNPGAQPLLDGSGGSLGHGQIDLYVSFDGDDMPPRNSHRTPVAHAKGMLEARDEAADRRMQSVAEHRRPDRQRDHPRRPFVLLEDDPIDAS